MLAIHHSNSGFHPRWLAYCEQHGIPHKRVNCHATDIIHQLKGCSGLLWHHSQNNPKDLLVAKQILFALEHSGCRVFPDFRTGWHFDDKVAQKYLFEALGIPTVPAYVFLDRDEALEWIDQAVFPKVFKLRRGAGSAGVRLASNRREARGLVMRAFGRGFRIYDPWGGIKEQVYKLRSGQDGLVGIGKGLARVIYPPGYSRLLGREKGYVYFQDYMPGNDCDIRVIVIGDRAFGIRRLVRPGDFRASGSGRITYAPEDIDPRCVRIAFEIASRLGGDCVALDFVFDSEGNPLALEVSYGFVAEGYDPCRGYWDRQLNWHEGPFDSQGWMIERIMNRPPKSTENGDTRCES